MNYSLVNLVNIDVFGIKIALYGKLFDAGHYNLQNTYLNSHLSNIEDKEIILSSKVRQILFSKLSNISREGERGEREVITL